jgi:hypothetical protein
MGHRLINPINAMLRQLHQQSAHGNRSLHMDHVVVAHLIAFCTPALKSLRRIEDVFNHRAARKRFGLPRIPHSTLSDAQAIFDPALLQPIIEDLRQRVPVLPHEPELDMLLKTMVAVDGSFFAMAPRVAWALYNKPNAGYNKPNAGYNKPNAGYNKPNAANEHHANEHHANEHHANEHHSGKTKKTKSSTKRPKQQRGNIRVDMHFNVITGVPEQAVVTDGRTPEYKTLIEHVLPDRFYVLDRAYHSYQMMADIIAAGSDFLVRLRSDMKFDVVEEHALSAEDRLAGVSCIQTVQPQSHRATSALDATPMKLVCIRAEEGSELRLLTNRVDLDASVIGAAYRHRWQIELFFRWLKCVVNFKHFFSESPNGVALQVAAAVIGTLLIALAIDDRPSSYDWSMMTHMMSGLLPADDETFEIMAKRRAERAREKARKQKKRASQKNAQ